MLVNKQTSTTNQPQQTPLKIRQLTWMPTTFIFFSFSLSIWCELFHANAKSLWWQPEGYPSTWVDEPFEK
jgi:hypothetical protein